MSHYCMPEQVLTPYATLKNGPSMYFPRWV